MIPYAYGYSSMKSFETIGVVCLLLALAATIALFVFVLPAKKNGKLGNNFLQVLHNIFNFKSLLLEVILKAIYVFFTCYIILQGFFTLFSVDALVGLLMMLLGPIVIRLSFEGIMMFIILVKKVISIDNKLKGEAKGNDPFVYKPAAPAASSEPRFDPNTGAPIAERKIVSYDPNTGAPVYEDNL